MIRAIIVVQRSLAALVILSFLIWSILAARERSPAIYLAQILTAGMLVGGMLKRKRVPDDREVYLSLLSFYCSFIFAVLALLAFLIADYIRFSEISPHYGYIIAVLVISQVICRAFMGLLRNI